MNTPSARCENASIDSHLHNSDSDAGEGPVYISLTEVSRLVGYPLHHIERTMEIDC